MKPSMTTTHRCNGVFLAIAGLIGAGSAPAAEVKHLRDQAMDAAPAGELAARLGLDGDGSLAALQSVKTVRETQVVRMQQYYKGVPVYGRSIAVEQDADGHALLANGSLLLGVQADLASVVPGLGAAQALAALRASKGFLPTSAQAPRNERAELYVYADGSGRARLAYLASYVVDGTSPSRPTAIIDAGTGQLIKQWEGLATAEATGPGGNLKTGMYAYGTNRPPLDVTQSGSTCTFRNARVETYDMNRQTLGPGTLWSFICPNSDEPDINNAYAPVNDAHYFAGVVHDMYQGWFGAPPLGDVLRMRVHYGTDYSNAFWDGTAASFGDGNGRFGLSPLVSLDKVAHEISHGFTEQHSQLEYDGQSGGINEAFSDMAGEAAEFFERGSNDFIAGAETYWYVHRAERSLCDPGRSGSIDDASDYNGQEPHQTSGVYNKAFCGLARTEGWDTKKAFEVFQIANAVHWTAITNFNEGACGVERAATDRGYAKGDVAAAFTGVGVRCSSDAGRSTVLQNGVPVTGLANKDGTPWNVSVAVPAGASQLKFEISGGQGDADLYVRFGAAPTMERFDCRPFLNGNQETCTFDRPSAGTYYVQLRPYAYELFSGVTLKASWVP